MEAKLNQRRPEGEQITGVKRARLERDIVKHQLAIAELVVRQVALAEPFLALVQEEMKLERIERESRLTPPSPELEQALDELARFVRSVNTDRPIEQTMPFPGLFIVDDPAPEKRS